jgi:hypothetical protein
MVQLLVAAIVWGVGNSVQGRRRHLKFLEQPAANHSLAKLGRRLVSAVELARSESPISAYAALHGCESGEGSLNVPHLGPSYGTKLLYFSSYSSSLESATPALILDQRVATALSWLTGAAWERQPEGWSAARYEEYLRLASNWAGQWPTEPDCVERVLFAIGKSQELAVRSFVEPSASSSC